MLSSACHFDISQIQSVLNAPANLGKLEAYSDEIIQAAIDSQATPIFVWKEGKQWQGFCWLRQSAEGTKIEEFGVVNPSEGVGKRFFATVLEQVKERDFPHPLWLNVAADNNGAIKFYEQFGFVKKSVKKAVWVRREGPVADAVTMVLDTELASERHPK